MLTAALAPFAARPQNLAPRRRFAIRERDVLGLGAARDSVSVRSVWSASSKHPRARPSGAANTKPDAGWESFLMTMACVVAQVSTSGFTRSRTQRSSVACVS